MNWIIFVLIIGAICLSQLLFVGILTQLSNYLVSIADTEEDKLPLHNNDVKQVWEELKESSNELRAKLQGHTHTWWLITGLATIAVLCFSFELDVLKLILGINILVVIYSWWVVSAIVTINGQIAQKVSNLQVCIFTDAFDEAVVEGPANLNLDDIPDVNFEELTTTTNLATKEITIRNS